MKSIEVKKRIKSKSVGQYEKEVGIIELKSKSNVDLKKVTTIISKFKDFYMVSKKDKVYLAFVEERDLNNEPSNFYIIEFTSSTISISYSISEDESPSVRKLDIFSKVLPLLEPILPIYSFSIQPLISLIDTALAQFLKKFTRDTKDVFIDNDRLREEIKDLQGKIKRKDKNIKELTSKLYEVNSELTELKMKLRKYTIPSKQVLEQQIIEWIKEHDGQIDIPEFSRIKDIPISRIEEILNSLIEKHNIKQI